ncbi:hypothetical protein VHUM_00391 [Vanrija humicola]|uniref:Uncharacterized protein n=1 Tax=Vanrija humicola TaxID=5417 RepID=A0A7D8V682_VANHU|nr:hypothetical protein VHUM_00391 [Vanrija humicola]
MWHPALFGYNFPNQSTDAVNNTQQNAPVTPLRERDGFNLTGWFWRFAEYPPAPGQFLELPSEGVWTAEISCNRAFTSWGVPNNQGSPWACPSVSDTSQDEGPLHTANKYNKPPDPRYFGGTALSIALTSDFESVRPEDFTIISVNATSPWTKKTEYKLPRLPKCPKGGCLVGWHWIHQKTHGEGYGDEMYFTMYRATVLKPGKKTKLGKGQVPRYCGNGTACVAGPKQPMYLFMKEGNNMDYKVVAAKENPTYARDYGFKDGAQVDALSGARALAPSFAVLAAALLGALVVL